MARILLAGDNDVGGEGNDLVTEEKVERFTKHFPQRDVTKLPGGNLSVVAWNELTGQFDEDAKIRSRKEEEEQEEGVKILVSHIPLLHDGAR